MVPVAFVTCHLALGTFPSGFHPTRCYVLCLLLMGLFFFFEQVKVEGSVSCY